MPEEKRRCSLCGKLLSIYNPDKICFRHPKHKENDGMDPGREHVRLARGSLAGMGIGRQLFMETLAEYEGWGDEN